MKKINAWAFNRDYTVIVIGGDSNDNDNDICFIDLKNIHIDNSCRVVDEVR